MVFVVDGCRLNEECSIQLFERGPFVSFANCGLPYFVGNVIEVRMLHVRRCAFTAPAREHYHHYYPQ